MAWETGAPQSRREGAGSRGARSLRVQLVLQFREFAGGFHFVGHVLPLGEEALALPEGQVLRGSRAPRDTCLVAAGGQAQGYSSP